MSLSEFLQNNKTRYLDAVRNGTSRDWTVVMGNEAGDLDTISSSIAYSWLATTVGRLPTVALLQTVRHDLILRPENLYTFSLAGIKDDLHELLCFDDVPAHVPFPSNKFALVDHNRLDPRFSDGNPDCTVVAVLDHHEDEGLYKDTANPRIVLVPTGSAASIVTRYMLGTIKPEDGVSIPRGIADLLIYTILIDTNGLKEGGKAVQLDYEAAAALSPISSLQLSGKGLSEEELSQNSAIKSLTHTLSQKKSEVSNLSVSDLLRRDYKPAEWTAHWVPDGRTVKAGVVTLPLGLKTFISRNVAEFWDSVDKYMDDRSLNVLSILASFSEEKKGKHKDTSPTKGKHKREDLFIVREIADGGLEERLWAGLEGCSELQLERQPMAKFTGDEFPDGGVGDRSARVYKQGNAKASRKFIMPLLKEIIEGKK